MKVVYKKEQSPGMDSAILKPLKKQKGLSQERILRLMEEIVNRTNETNRKKNENF